MNATARERLNTVIETTTNFRDALATMATDGKVDLDVVVGGLEDILNEAGEPGTGDDAAEESSLQLLHIKVNRLIGMVKDGPTAPPPAKVRTVKVRGVVGKKAAAKRAPAKRKVTGRSLFARKGRK